jgi:toxin FitB
VTGYLLDTNVVSELRKGSRVDRNLRRWFDDRADAECWLSVLVVGELQRGIELIGRRDQAAASVLKSWLDSVMAGYDDRIIPVTTAICLRWAGLSVPDPLPVVDGLLAATALEHGLTFVTRNVNDVQRTGVAVVNPFDPSQPDA